MTRVMAVCGRLPAPLRRLVAVSAVLALLPAAWIGAGVELAARRGRRGWSWRRVVAGMVAATRAAPGQVWSLAGELDADMVAAACQRAAAGRDTVALPLVCAACSAGLSVGHSGSCGGACRCAPGDARVLWGALDLSQPDVCRTCGGLIDWTLEDNPT